MIDLARKFHGIATIQQEDEMLRNCRPVERVPVQIHIGICTSRTLAKNGHEKFQAI